MTSSTGDMRERMIEYLYGELDGEELRAFEQHLRESEEDRRELAELQATLGRAREGLQLKDDAPPPGVRRAVLAAAAVAPRARAPRWLRTSFVVVPALAVAAAALLVVLGKNIEAPRVTRERAAPAEGAASRERSGLPPSAATTSARGAPIPAQPHADDEANARRAAEPAGEEEAFGTRANARRAAGDEDALGTRPVARDDQPAAAPAHSGAAPPAKASRSSAEPAFAAPPREWKRERQPPSAAKRSAPGAEDDVSGDSSDTAPPARAAPATLDARAGRAQLESESPPTDNAAFTHNARPPSAADKARAPADVPAASNDAAATRTKPMPDPAQARSVAAAAAQAAPAAPPRAAAPVGSVATPAAETTAAAAPSAHDGAPNPSLSISALDHRARDHLAAKRWREAAADYRELLRRSPTSARAPLWKKQLTIATQAH